MKIEEAIVGQNCFALMRTRMREAYVVAVYSKPAAIRVKVGVKGEEWVLKPEEVFTPEEKEKLDNPANQ